MARREITAGLVVQLIISEPWDFETEVGTGILDGRVSEIKGDDVVIALDQPVWFSGVTIASLRATARYEGQRARDACEDKMVCNFDSSALSANGPSSHLIGTLRVC